MSTLKGLAASGQGEDRRPAARDDDVGEVHLVRHAVPEGGIREGGSDREPVHDHQRAGQGDAQERTQAEADITDGATVLLVDPIDSGVGAPIETYAKAHGVKVIDYDRLDTRRHA